MLNINELEDQWLKYKIKSFLPHLIIVASLIVIFIVISFFNFDLEQPIPEIKNNKDVIKNIENNKSTENKSTSETVPKIENTINIEKEIINPSKIKQTTTIKTIPTEDEKLRISPSLDFIQNINRNSPAYYDNVYSKPPVIHKKKVTPKKQEVIEVAKVKVEEVPKAIATIQNTPVAEKTAIKINRQNTQEDIQHVVKRFKKSNNPALSLFIAKKYYELEMYNQSYNYALITNELNNDIEDSWIIFAKSLYKLDKKDKAIEILKQYISTSHSSRAQMLVDNIKSGKLK